ncbi:hypothetical protein GCM10009429_05550 [Dyella marensis]
MQAQGGQQAQARAGNALGNHQDAFIALCLGHPGKGVDAAGKPDQIPRSDKAGNLGTGDARFDKLARTNRAAAANECLCKGGRTGHGRSVPYCR